MTPTSKKSRRTKRQAFDFESHKEINPFDFLTGGKPGCLLMLIDGASTIAEIKTGSWVIVDPDQAPKSGESVVCRLEGRNSCQYFSERKNGLYLVSAKTKQSLQRKDKPAGNIVGVILRIITRPASKK